MPIEHYKHGKKKQSLQPFLTSPSGGKWTQDLESDVILRPVRALMGFKGITWPPSPASL